MGVTASKFFTCPLFSVLVERFMMLTKNIYQQGPKSPLGALNLQGVEKAPKSQRKPKVWSKENEQSK